MSTKSVLIINRSGPYGNSKPRESLDIALTCSIFEMPVSLVFLDDAVLQLRKNQQPDQLNQKNLESMLASLPMYDIDKVYASSEALNTYGIELSDMSLPVEAINSTDLSELINNHDTVLTF